MRPLRPGDPTEIGGYQLRARLGSGGMGTVYLASTPGGRLVAVKSIRSELIADDEFQQRFRLEVRAARQVRGLYTAELLDADPDSIPPWLVTAYVPGPSLAQAVKTQGPVPYELVPLLMAGVAEALLDIHAAGIVHRDLKASNVLLSPDGPRVIDFGIAKALGASRLTLTGVTMGSPECMTPEQVHGLPVTQAADIFSLGSLCTFAATSGSPFAAPNSAAMMYRVVHEAPVLDGIPPGLRELLERCFAKDPGNRPSPTEVLKMCRALMPEWPTVFPQSWRRQADSGTPEFHRAEQLVPAGDARSASRRVRLDLHRAPPQTGDVWDPAAREWDSPAGGWDSPAQPNPDFTAPPTPAGSALLGPKLKPRPARAPGPKTPAAAWLMYGAAAVATAALAAGLVTLPSLRTTLGQHHPGSTNGNVAAAVNLAVAVLAIQALTSVGTWLWAALDTSRGHRRARTIAYVALAVSTLGLASSSLGLTTPAGQGLTLIGWLVGLAAVAVGWPGRSRR
jgi:serine/threonine protein kinase